MGQGRRHGGGEGPDRTAGGAAAGGTGAGGPARGPAAAGDRPVRAAGDRKTTFARGIAARLGWPFVELLPSRLADEGNLAAALRSAFARIAELERVLVFIDEVEEIAPVKRRTKTRKRFTIKCETHTTTNGIEVKRSNLITERSTT
ncbi:AAA family ATPase, partial [Streptomyces albulus]|nr:AAA family ATPase [Streptomyces noursei]